MSTDDTNAARRGSGSNDLLGQASEARGLRAWLVEWRFNGTQWLYLTGGSFNFTADPNRALRLARRADAEAAMQWAVEFDRRRGLRPTGEMLVTEHEWPNAKLTGPSETKGSNDEHH